MAAPTIQFKRGQFANVGLASFKAGEPGFTTDKYDFYIGLDGTAANQKFFGSARYWTRETASSAAGLNFYGQTSSNNYISIKGPDSPSGIGTYTLPDTSTIVDGYFLKVSTGGALSWASSSSGVSLNNVTLSGITTFTGVVDNDASTTYSGIVTFLNTTANTLGNADTGSVQFDGGVGINGNVTVGSGLSVTGNSTLVGTLSVNGNTTLGDAAGDTITVNGTATFGQTITGTISTATRALNVDTTTASATTYYPALLGSSTGTSSTSIYVDGGIAYNASTDTLTLTGDLAVNGADVTTSGGTATLFNANATTVNAFGAATALVMGATTGIATINNPTVVGTQATQNVYNTVATTLNFGGAATSLNLGAASGTATVNNTTVTLANATTLNVNGANPTIAGTSTGTLTLFNTNLTAINAFGAATAVNIAASTGITTIRNSLRVTNSLYDSANSAGSNGQFLTVTASGIGWTTISGVSGGTISTATRANTVDSSSTNDTGTFYPALFSSSSAANGATVYVDGGMSFDASLNTLTLTGDLAVNGADVTTSGGTATLFNANATTVNAFGAATALNMGATTGIATINNPTLVGTQATQNVYNTVATTVNAFGAASTLVVGATTGTITVNNPTLVGTQATQNVYNTVATTLNFGGAATSLNLGAASGTATVNNTTVTLANATTLNVNGANPTIAGTSTGTLNFFNTNLTAVNAFGAANTIFIGKDSTGITTVRTKLTVGGNLEVDGNQIQSSTGATVLTLSSQDATFANNVTVSGNLVVNGTTTQVNTQELQVYDRTITLGIQSGTTPTTTTWDLGVMMNYGVAGVGSTAGMIWESSNRRFQFASMADNPTAGVSTSLPQITVSAFAPIEVSELWVNNSCSGGSSRIVGCTAGTLILENITVDCGTF